jgi:hypothetical protein
VGWSGVADCCCFPPGPHHPAHTTLRILCAREVGGRAASRAARAARLRDAAAGAVKPGVVKPPKMRPAGGRGFANYTPSPFRRHWHPPPVPFPPSRVRARPRPPNRLPPAPSLSTHTATPSSCLPIPRPPHPPIRWRRRVRACERRCGAWGRAGRRLPGGAGQPRTGTPAPRRAPRRATHDAPAGLKGGG